MASQLASLPFLKQKQEPKNDFMFSIENKDDTIINRIILLGMSQLHSNDGIRYALSKKKVWRSDRCNLVSYFSMLTDCKDYGDVLLEHLFLFLYVL